MMSPLNEVFEAIPFDVSSDATKPLIAAGDAEDEDERLDEKSFSSFNLSSLLLGFFVGFFIQFSTLGAECLAVWGKYFVLKSETDVAVFSLLWSLFTSAMPVLILVFIRNLVTIPYSAGRGSEELLEDMILQLECRFGVGVLAGFCIAWTVTDVLLGMRSQVAYCLVPVVGALFWYAFMMASAAESKRQRSRRSTTEPDVLTA
jgi:hypothetical protein